MAPPQDTEIVPSPDGTLVVPAPEPLPTPGDPGNAPAGDSASELRPAPAGGSTVAPDGNASIDTGSDLPPLFFDLLETGPES